MEDNIAKLLASCSKIDFGDICLSQGEKKFCHDWNRESILLCKSLPPSTQTDALLFFIKYAKTSLEKLNLFRMYYVPAWSIIYWLIQSGPGGKELNQNDIHNAKAAHFMAMFLHALDDHLTDHQLPVTHLTLLLRSHAWMIMNSTLSSLADGIDGGQKIIQRFIDDYYYSIRTTEDIESLDHYCDRFRKQMATWLLVPFLITKKIAADEAFSDAVQAAYGSFGLAWRMLDDIKDIEADLINGVQSAISVCLPKNIRNFRGKASGREKEGIHSRDVQACLDYIFQNNVIEKIKERICRELKSAAFIADNYHMIGLANEFRCLYSPLMYQQEHL